MAWHLVSLSPFFRTSGVLFRCRYGLVHCTGRKGASNNVKTATMYCLCEFPTYPSSHLHDWGNLSGHATGISSLPLIVSTALAAVPIPRSLLGGKPRAIAASFITWCQNTGICIEFWTKLIIFSWNTPPLHQIENNLVWFSGRKWCPKVQAKAHVICASLPYGGSWATTKSYLTKTMPMHKSWNLF